jgi:hypothetical protein
MIKAPQSVMLCLLLVACSSILGDSDSDENVVCDGVTDDSVQFELFIWGDASFQSPHADDLLLTTMSCTGGDGFLGSGGGSSGPLSPPTDTISFGFGSTVDSGATYQIYIWIDSNIGGGTVGVCDPPAIDHQWIVTIPTVTEDVNIIFSHDDATVTDVCSAFDGLDLYPFDL